MSGSSTSYSFDLTVETYLNWTFTSNSVIFNETYPWFLPFTHTKFLLSFINSSSMIPVLSLKVSPKPGDDIAGAPISNPINLSFLSYRFETVSYTHLTLPTT